MPTGFECPIRLVLLDDLTAVLVNAVSGYNASHAGGGIYVAVSADHGTGIADCITANLYVITKHGAEFFHASLHLFRAIVYDNKLLVALYVGGDGTCAHMTVIAKDTVANIVIMRRLYVVKKNHVL